MLMQTVDCKWLINTQLLISIKSVDIYMIREIIIPRLHQLPGSTAIGLILHS